MLRDLPLSILPLILVQLFGKDILRGLLVYVDLGIGIRQS